MLKKLTVVIGLIAPSINFSFSQSFGGFGPVGDLSVEHGSSYPRITELGCTGNQIAIKAELPVLHNSASTQANVKFYFTSVIRSGSGMEADSRLIVENYKPKDPKAMSYGLAPQAYQGNTEKEFYYDSYANPDLDVLMSKCIRQGQEMRENVIPHQELFFEYCAMSKCKTLLSGATHSKTKKFSNKYSDKKNVIKPCLIQIDENGNSVEEISYLPNYADYIKSGYVKNEDRTISAPGIANQMGLGGFNRYYVFGTLASPKDEDASSSSASATESSVYSASLMNAYLQGTDSMLLDKDIAKNVFAVASTTDRPCFVSLKEVMIYMFEKAFTAGLSPTSAEGTRLRGYKETLSKWHLVDVMRTYYEPGHGGILTLVGLGINPKDQMELFCFQCCNYDFAQAVGIHEQEAKRIRDAEKAKQ